MNIADKFGNFKNTGESLETTVEVFTPVIRSYLPLTEKDSDMEVLLLLFNDDSIMALATDASRLEGFTFESPMHFFIAILDIANQPGAGPYVQTIAARAKPVLLKALTSGTKETHTHVH